MLPVYHFAPPLPRALPDCWAFLFASGEKEANVYRGDTIFKAQPRPYDAEWLLSSGRFDPRRHVAALLEGWLRVGREQLFNPAVITGVESLPLGLDHTSSQSVIVSARRSCRPYLHCRRRTECESQLCTDIKHGWVVGHDVGVQIAK